MVSTGSVSNLIQTNIKRNGGWICLTCITHGALCVLTAFYFPAIKPPRSFEHNDPVANIVSAINLHHDCPPSLLTALAYTHPDHKVWLQSYYEEKSSIKDMGTYQRLSLGEYRALREKGAPRAIPSMCVLTIKRDASLLPVHAKSRIVVLGNHEDRSWSKSERYAPVLKSESLRYFVSLAMEHRKTLQQDDYKNAFCNGDLPPDEVTIIRPPNGDPDTRKDEFWLLCKTLYGLRRSPRHWYDKIKKILLSMGLKQNIYDPCLFTGFVRNPGDPTDSPATVPLTLGLYVDDFIFFSASDEVKKKFQAILSRLIKVDFMGVLEWFLGIHFQWQVTKDDVSVHMNQAGFATNPVERFDMHFKKQTHTAPPYWSGIPIDATPDCSGPNDLPAQNRRREAYQNLVGSIGWLAACTRPDLDPVHSFLSSYNGRLAPGHMKAALYVLHYIHSTHDYSISFTSKDKQPIHIFLHFPDS